jgi:hypothetical protein
MRYGDRGKRVAELNDFLHERNYPCDGDIFNEDTLLSLIHYQHHHGHRTTGIFDERDFDRFRRDSDRFGNHHLRGEDEKFFHENLLDEEKPNEQIAQQILSGEEEKNFKWQTIQKDSTGSDVFFFQNALKQLGFYQGNLDGSFGDKTHEACKNFQKSCGLTTDGVGGQKTWHALKDHLSFIILPASKRPVLKLSDKGDYVRMLQGGLKISGFYQGEECGMFDDRTHQAVCRFQSVADFIEDEGAGVVGAKTWEALDWYFYL